MDTDCIDIRDGHAPIFSNAHQRILALIANICISHIRMAIPNLALQAGHRGWGPDCPHQRTEHMTVRIPRYLLAES